MSEITVYDIERKAKELYGNKKPYITLEEWTKKQVELFNSTEGKLHLKDGYSCPYCKNKGVIAKIGADGAEVHYYCKCMKIRKSLYEAQNSGLKAVLSSFTFKNFITDAPWQKNIKDTAVAFCKDENAKWFFIGGQPGCGKTHICTAISSFYLKQGCQVKYMNWCEDSKKLKGVINDFLLYEKEFSLFKKVQVLYIDDFLKTKGGEEPTKGDINLAFELINHRLMNGSYITIISSEKSLRELGAFDEGTMSRIYQCTGQYKITIGADKRKNFRIVH